MWYMYVSVKVKIHFWYHSVTFFSRTLASFNQTLSKFITILVWRVFLGPFLIILWFFPFNLSFLSLETVSRVSNVLAYVGPLLKYCAKIFFFRKNYKKNYNSVKKGLKVIYEISLEIWYFTIYDLLLFFYAIRDF